MRVAILYNNKDVYVEFSPEKFRKLLKEMLKEYKGDSDKALDAIVSLIKKETLKV